ncbi:Alkaline phosphatase [Rhodomicrobium vannielii ATCC 17100]|uniref:Alkaline phosphatase n=1 Tax=Rhodomicrobium vannielii (strain ATCC 17100 / DSM 162 / LMG 4299 / NCIMB 10020 / ATH 3.1.1) TaxID=648757 RepID=E3I7W1_RHOVT|nr:alkaline phosphatase [Rhodomicrobium vannielii]ADP70815.1 Alkaline phosphatase [Rhodomicrobium vannielii ATCC 17100]
MTSRTLAVALGLAGVAALCAPAQAQGIKQAQDSYFLAAKADLEKILARQPNTKKAKNIILFIGDGMSIPTVTAARIMDGQRRGVDGESNSLAFETLLPYVALSKTYTHDSQVADSAPTATALVSGVKSVNGTIGVDQHVTVGNCASQKGTEVTTIFELAEKAGLSTGIVSTARITHATPAAAYAKTAGRDWEVDTNLPGPAKAAGCKDIATQLVEWPAGNGFEVILGGGRSYFLPKEVADPETEGKTGTRADGRNLVDEWQRKYNDAAYVWNKEQFDAIDPAKTGHVLGLFERSHMQYEAERAKDKAGEPSLAEMTTKAIDFLSKNKDGFVLMVEGGRIDHAHHDGKAGLALLDTLALDEAVKAAYAKVDPEETLIILTADHSHVFSISGYPKRGNPILGLAGYGLDGKPYTTLGYLNGPGAKANEARADLNGVDTTALDFRQQALIPLDAESHAGDDVAVFAQGPSAHLFQGVIEQNMIFHVMTHASGILEKVGRDTAAAK